MRHFLTTNDWSKKDLESLLEQAQKLKQNPVNTKLSGKSIALLFLNPSLRTRTSFELGMQQMGGIAIVLQPGKDAWGLEFESGTVMDGDAEEHIAEVAAVHQGCVREVRRYLLLRSPAGRGSRKSPKATATARTRMGSNSSVCYLQASYLRRQVPS